MATAGEAVVRLATQHGAVRCARALLFLRAFGAFGAADDSSAAAGGACAAAPLLAARGGGGCG